MTDPDIKVGDVCIDLVKRGKVQVVERPAGTVAEHRAEEGFDLAEYKSHPLLDVTDDEPVYRCVYLPDNPTTSFNGTYDFPASRLARVPVEEANQDVERIQPQLVTEVLAKLLENALVADGAGDTPPQSFEAAIRHCWPSNYPEVMQAAEELADARYRARTDAEVSADD